MRIFLRALVICIVAVVLFTMPTGCGKKEEGTLEKIGKAADDAAKESAGALEDAATEAKKGAE